MSASLTELTGGNFQDGEGNLLTGGYLTFRLNQDSNVNDSQVCSGVQVKILLDIYGSIIAGQYVWGNDDLSPVNSYYTVTGFTANGQIAWGPNNQQVVSGGTFDVGTWVPNQVISWTPPTVPIVLKTNGTLNGSQTELNIQAGANITCTDNDAGTVTIASAVSPATTYNFSSIQNFMGFEGDAARMVDGISAGGGCPAVQVTLPVPVVVSKISINVTTDHASSHGFAALYSADGTTKIIDAGHDAFDTSSTGVKTVTLGTPITLPAGSYLIAWSNDGGSTNVLVTGVGATALDYSTLTLLSTNANRYVRAANGITSGNMPTTLGTLTFPAISSDDFDIPMVMFE
jgi:hypothetical protein